MASTRVTPVNEYRSPPLKTTLQALSAWPGTTSIVGSSRGLKSFELGFRAKVSNWEFPKVRGTLFGGPYNKDPTI